MNLGLWGSISPKTVLGAIRRGAGGVSSYTISGTVYDADGSTPVEGATVALGLLTATSAANGTYTISDVPAGTSGSMTCTKTGYSWTAITVAAMAGNLTNQNYSNAWWAAGGVAASCLAAYMGKGAATAAASYINLANPGTYDLTVPSGSAVIPWAQATGWTKTAGDGKFFDTGIVPNPANFSFVIRYANVVESTDERALFGVLLGDYSKLTAFYARGYNGADGSVTIAATTTSLAAVLLSGTVAVGESLYSGTTKIAAAGRGTATYAASVWLGGSHREGTNTVHRDTGAVYVAASFYNAKFSDAAAVALVNAINALP